MGCHKNTWKYHRDSAYSILFSQKNFPLLLEKFSQLPENFSGKKHLNMHGITMIFPDVFEDIQTVKICARMAAWRHKNTWKYHRDSMHIQMFFARKIFQE